MRECLKLNVFHLSFIMSFMVHKKMFFYFIFTHFTRLCVFYDFLSEFLLPLRTPLDYWVINICFLQLASIFTCRPLAFQNNTCFLTSMIERDLKNIYHFKEERCPFLFTRRPAFLSQTGIDLPSFQTAELSPFRFYVFWLNTFTRRKREVRLSVWCQH